MYDVDIDWIELCKQLLIEKGENYGDMCSRIHFSIGVLRQAGREDIAELLEMIEGSCFSKNYEW